MSPKPKLSVLQTAGPPLRRLVEGSNTAIVGFLIRMVCVTIPDNRRPGSVLPILLPFIAMVCAATDRTTVNSPGRLDALKAGINGPKNTLSHSPIGQSPDEGGKNFPAGQTAVASFGATLGIKQSLAPQPVPGASAVAVAAFAGGAWIGTGRHSRWKAVANSFYGWDFSCRPLAGMNGADRCMRKVNGRHV